MICTSCGADNDVGRKFCLACGQRLAVACASCGSPNTPGARFCGECGSAIAAPEAGPSQSAVPVTERRLVSVLFADLVGFTTLSEARDAEDVRELLAGYFDACRAIVERYGGTVEKFIGDAVMAVWGTPTAQEDDAERAVRAALDLVDGVRRLGAERGMADLALRAAVHTGEAVVTMGASGMGMVAGDLVNTASRLQSVAPPGTVLVGDSTRRAASNAIVFEEAGEQVLKGKASPVPAFRALRVVAQRGGVGRSEGLEPPFVGRDAELQLIKDFYHATAREPAPRLVSVMGQAGIGKSRLAWEFLKYIDGVTEIVYWHQGRSPAYGEGISFWALAEMVRMRLGIGETADEATTRASLSERLAEFVPDADERRELTEPLLHLLGIGDGGGRERGQLFVAWRTFFERIAEAGPVVMVFEDLQWADPGMLDFIEELVGWSRRSIYIITLARPELLDRRPTWGAGQRAFTSLSLTPLEDADMRALLGGLVPGLPAAVIDQIVGRAEGIPLYAVETVRTLLNDGRIERDGDVVRPVGDLGQLAVPESLQALIAARIDALPAPERTLVQDASVLGLSFADAALRAVARSSPDEIAAMLGHLVQRELLTVDDDPRSPERGYYRFVQGLLREVAYGTLAREDRRARHLAAARYYEALGDDELSGVLAQHYVDAYQAHPDGPEGAAVAAQARVALRAAAQRAADLGSHRHAHGYLESALLVATEPAEELDLRTAAFWASSAAGLLEVATEHGERVVALAERLGRDEERRVGIANLANVLIEGHQQRALDMLNAVMREPDMSPAAAGWLTVAVVLAKAEMRMLHDERAIELADEVLRQVPEPERDDELILDLLITRATSLSNVGRKLEGITILTGALDVARRQGLDGAAGRAIVNLTYALILDDPLRSYEIAREAVDEAIRRGVVWQIRYILGNAIDSGIEVGAWDWAMDAMAETSALFTEPAERLWFGSLSGVIRAFRGEDVEDEARQLYAASRDIDDAQYRALGGYAIAVSALVRGALEDAQGLSQEAMAEGISGLDGGIYGVRAAIWRGDVAAARQMRQAFAAAGEGRRQTAHLAAMDGGIAMLEGRLADARTHFADAQRRFRELGTRHWLGLTDLDIVVTGAMEPAERAAAAEEVREIYTDLRATALLERLDTALAADRDRVRPAVATPIQPAAEVSREA